VARKHGINANQVFQWRRLYRSGHLGGPPSSGLKLLAVTVREGPEILADAPTSEASTGAGAIHIELPEGARISLEGSVDPAVVRAVIESLRP
jgi:transposase